MKHYDQLKEAEFTGPVLTSVSYLLKTLYCIKWYMIIIIIIIIAYKCINKTKKDDVCLQVRDAEALRDTESRKCVEAQKGAKRIEKKVKDTEIELQESIRQGKILNEQIDKHMSEGRKLRQLYEEAVRINFGIYTNFFYMHYLPN